MQVPKVTVKVIDQPPQQEDDDIGKEYRLMLEAERWSTYAGILSGIGREPAKLRRYHERLLALRREVRQKGLTDYPPLDYRIAAVQAAIRRTRGKVRKEGW